MYAAGAVAAYLGLKYYKNQQGKLQQPQAPTTPTAPSSPTFQGASQAYIKNEKILQTFLGVTVDGIIGQITQASAAKYDLKNAIKPTKVFKQMQRVQFAK